MKKSELIFSGILLPIDYLMVVLAGLSAYYLRFQSFLTEIRPVFYEMGVKEYLFVILLVGLIFIAVFAMTGLYAIKGTRRVIDELAKIFAGCSSSILLLIIIIFFQRELFSSRFIILSGWILSVIYVSIARIIIRLVQHSLFVRGVGLHNVIIIGQDKTTEDIVKFIHLKPSQGLKMIARFDHFTDENYEKAVLLARQKMVDEIILAESTLPREEVSRIFDYCNDYHVSFKYAAGLMDAQSERLEINTVAGIPIIEVKKTPLDGWGRIIKRIMDMLLSLIALIITSPLIILVAIAVKLDSEGPVLVRLQRIGEHGKLFTLYKFRSMIKNAHSLKKNLIELNERKDGPLFKIKNDPRITRVGRFIRKTSLDELPQFINVLRGEMSLVGPRPHEPEEVANYQKHHRKLLAIKPGITGMAQVSGRSDLIFEEEVKLDLFYIENWSLRLDLQIIIKTPFVVISTRSAS